MQGRRPAERTRPGTADALIQGERIGVRPHFRPRLRKWNVADVRTHPAMKARTEDEMTVPGARILLVEDDPRVRTATVGALEDLGYDPVACASGAEAIDLFKAHEFDLVISDVIMPEMTGPELIRHLKATESREFAVLFVTGYVGEGESDELRGHELLRKPFTVGALAGAVSAALARTTSVPPQTSRAAAKG